MPRPTRPGRGAAPQPPPANPPATPPSTPPVAPATPAPTTPPTHVVVTVQPPRTPRRCTTTVAAPQDAGWLRTNQSLQSEVVRREDRIVHPLLYTVLKCGAVIGLIALLVVIFGGGYWAGSGSTAIRPVTLPTGVWRSVPLAPPPVTVIVQPAPPAQQPPRPLSHEERAEKLKEELRRQYGAQ